MKRILALVIASLVATSASAQVTSQKLMSAGMPAQLAEIVAGIGSGGTVVANQTYIKGRNAADSADINVWKVDATDDTVLNADTGDVIKLSVAGTSEVQIDNDSLTFTGASASLAFGATSGLFKVNGNTELTLADDKLTLAGAAFKVVPGATSVTFRDTTDASDNLKIVDAGDVTVRGQVTSTGFFFPAANFETVAGAGSTVSDAAALSATKHVHQITGANGTLGWKFATATAGQFEVLLNTTAGVAKVYAVSGGTCNGGAADAACTLLSGIAPHICYATATNAWICS